MYKKLSAIKEVILSGCGFKNEDEILFEEKFNTKLNSKLFNYIIGKALLINTKDILGSRNLMAIIGVGSFQIQTYLDVIGSCVLNALDKYGSDYTDIPEKITRPAILSDIAIQLLRTHKNEDISSDIKKTCIEIGLEILTSLKEIKHFEAEEIKIKIYTEANLTSENEDPTIDYNLKFFHDRIFS